MFNISRFGNASLITLNTFLYSVKSIRMLYFFISDGHRGYGLRPLSTLLCLVLALPSVSILHTSSFGGKLLALGRYRGLGLCPQQGPGQNPCLGGLGQSPQKLKAVCFTSS